MDDNVKFANPIWDVDDDGDLPSQSFQTHEGEHEVRMDRLSTDSVPKGSSSRLDLDMQVDKDFDAAVLLHLDEGTLVFGSTKEADDLEYEMELWNRARWCGLLHPHTFTSTVYDMTQLTSICYILVVLPFRVAFDIVSRLAESLLPLGVILL